MRAGALKRWWLLALLALAGCVRGADLSPIVEALADYTTSGVIPSSWTLLVRSDGPRWLGPAWWQARGVDVHRARREGVRLTQAGKAVPFVWIDAPDGPGLLFYAEAVSIPGGATGAYVLTVGGTGDAPASLTAPSSEIIACQTKTRFSRWFEEDLAFRPTTPLDSPWLWQMLRPDAPLTERVPLTDAVATEPVELTVRAWGQSSMPQNPDHHIRVTWNDQIVDEHAWDGNGTETWSIELSPSADEVNTLTFAAPGLTEAPVEVTWLDAFGLSWTRPLRLSVGGLTAWEATGELRACWSADGDMPQDTALVAVLREDDGAVRYLQPAFDEATNRWYVDQHEGDLGWIGLPWVAPTPEYVRATECIEAQEFSGVTYLVIAPRETHRDLVPLLEKRRAEGRGLGVVTPEAVYDAYGSGVPDAGAIQRMIRSLHQEGSLEKVLLVGDASADAEWLWSTDALAVPTVWVRTTIVGHTASDYHLATGGTDTPLVALGRFPATSIDDVRTLVAKTVQWEPHARLALVKDDEPGFASLVAQLGDIGAVDLVLDAGAEDARKTLLAWLREASGTLVYVGHGSMRMLGDEQLMVAEDGGSWQHPTVMVAWSCLCASFAHPTHASLAESWLLAPKGVVAVVGPTGETTTLEQSAMALTLQEELAQGAEIGDALMEAWQAARSEDARDGFLLLGDPALQPMPGDREGVSDG